MIEFARPAFLWALPAVLIPILLHLLFRRRYRRVQWAAMEHLLRAERATRRRMRLRELLLLAMRTAAVLLLVLVFARPSALRALPGAGGGSREEVHVLLDDSASMTDRSGGEAAFDRALRYVRALAARCEVDGAPFTLHVTSRALPVYRSARRGTRAGAQRALAALRPTGTGFDRYETLRAFSQAAAPYVSAAPRFVIVTDLRAADWEPPTPGSTDALLDLAGAGWVTIVDVGAEPEADAGVVGLTAAGRYVYAGLRTQFRATVRNSATGPLPAGLLDARLNGAQLAPVPCPEVPPGGERDALLDVAVADPGVCTLEVALRGEDALPADDRRWLAFEAVESVPVLAVEGRGGAAAYLAAALEPSPGAPGLRAEVRGAALGLPFDRLTAPRRRSGQALSSVEGPDELAGYAAIFLCDLDDPRPWSEALSGYVQHGGRLVAFLGTEADPAAWGASLLDASRGLVPSRLSGPVELPEGQSGRLVLADRSDPLVAPFADWDAVFGAARFRAWWSLEPAGPSRAIGRFEGDQSGPAVVVRRLGDGVAVVVATAPDDRWSDWPRSEVGRAGYVALMHWLVEQGSPADPALNLTAGPTADQAGVGEMRFTERDGREVVRRFVVNVPVREFEMARQDADALQAAYAGARVQVVRYAARGRAEPGEGAGPELWPWLAAALIALLVVESAAAFLSGNPRGRLAPGGEGRR